MGIKPKKRVKARAKAQVTISTADKTVRAEKISWECPTEGSLHSTVGVSLGMRLSKPGTYSSASCEVSVTLPCTPGTEQETGGVAFEKSQEIYNDYSEEFERTVDNL